MRYLPKTLTGKVLTASLAVVVTAGVVSGIALVRQNARWAVKTGTDADAGLVDLANPVKTDVASLRAMDRPETLPRARRVAPVETTVYVVAATLTQYKRQPDGDYHLILADEDGETIITELPDPGRVGASSPFRDHIAKARAAFDARFQVTWSWQSANVPVVVSGIGFFDHPHGQVGAAPNQIELHPVLDVQFP